MGKRRQEKETMLEALKERLGKTEMVIFADYRGLKVSDMTDLRNRMRPNGTEVQVVKNTLARMAGNDLGIGMMDRYLVGPTAMVFAGLDVASPARILQDFTKDHKALEIKGGLLNEKPITADDIKTIAELPGREVLLGRVLGGLQAPLVGTAGVLQSLLRNFVYVLDRVREVKSTA